MHEEHRINWRVVAWMVPVLLLLIPLIARAPWTLGDFLIAAVVFGAIGIVLELAVRRSTSLIYRAAVTTALAAVFLLFWINGAVGIIGDEENPANLMYLAIITIAAIGTAIAKGRARGMSQAMLAATAVQALVTVIALAAGLGASEPPGRWGILILNTGFVALFLTAAWLFRTAARKGTALSNRAA